VGHRRRRAEGAPLLRAKFESALGAQLPARRVRQIVAASREPGLLDAMPIHHLLNGFSQLNAP
jgi:2-methylcitrate dehydratase